MSLFKQTVDCKHKTPYKLIQDFREEQHATDTMIKQINSGQEVVKPKLQRDIDAKIKLVVSNYSTFDSFSKFFEALLPNLVTVKKLKRVSNKAKLALSQK